MLSVPLHKVINYSVLAQKLTLGSRILSMVKVVTGCTYVKYDKLSGTVVPSSWCLYPASLWCPILTPRISVFSIWIEQRCKCFGLFLLTTGNMVSFRYRYIWIDLMFSTWYKVWGCVSVIATDFPGLCLRYCCALRFLWQISFCCMWITSWRILWMLFWFRLK